MNCGGSFDFDEKQIRLEEITRSLEDPDIWSDNKRTQELGREKKLLESVVITLNAIGQQVKDAGELLLMAREENDDETLEGISQDVLVLEKEVSGMEFRRMFSDPMDPNNCFIDIQSGSGGTEAQDWAEMLLRMYLRWANSRGMKTEILEEQSGDEAGIKSATIKVKGENAFGWLKTESGVHRLVRISPYDSSARRHTSFASVWIYPEIDDTIEVDIDESDCRIDTFRASGSGGQHINKTDSAVRITHEPTGIVVQCQNDRSQHKNRSQAWDMLRSRLYERELKLREDAAQAQADSKSEIGWGHQIRSYVLQPYQMVKDLRTGVETSDTNGVLDGDLDKFMAAALALKLEG